eukprot:s3266_g6.t1
MDSVQKKEALENQRNLKSTQQQKALQKQRNLRKALQQQQNLNNNLQNEEQALQKQRTRKDKLRGIRPMQCDWMRDLVEPIGYEDRHNIDATLWSENFRMYRRDELIQADLEWLIEAAYDFYQRHLDNLIRSNERLWGDFCKRNEDEHGNTEDAEGNTLGLEMVPPVGGFQPNVEYKRIKHNIIPLPEKHFSFSTKMMLLAIQLYRDRSDYQFHPFTQLAYEKLESYVKSKRQLTKESYRHFVERAYNQFFVHPAFLESPRSRTRAKDIGASEPLGTSTKLDGYVWIQDSTGTKRIPKSKVEEMDDVPMPDAERPDPYSEFPEEMKVDEDQPDQQEHQPPRFNSGMEYHKFRKILNL